MDKHLDTMVPENPRKLYDIKEVIHSIVDNGDILEPHEHYAKNMVICLCDGWLDL